MIAVMHGGPPCCTWSAARYKPGGPPPAVDRHHLFGLAHLRFQLLSSCNRGSEIALRYSDLMRGVLSCGGYASWKHPDDRGCKPFPSWWVTPQWRALVTQFGLIESRFHQCEFWAPTKRPTRL
eukprot:2652161-Heterocapsa_arctica.AAC.1